MLRPVLDCLEGLLDLEHNTQAADRSAGLDLLLGVDEHDREDASALQELVRHCTRELGCVTGALVVPDKNIEFSCSNDASQEVSQLLDRTQKHLLAWVRLNNRPMVVNRAGGAAPYKILSCPLRDPHGSVLGLVAMFRATEGDDFEPRDVRILEFVGRKAVAILGSELRCADGIVRIASSSNGALSARSTEPPTALLYVDIDKVAAINETFGLSAGDEVIQRVGGLIQRAAGPGALVSRIAGDRFAVALPGRASHRGKCDRREARSRRRASSAMSHGSEALPVSVSIGAVVGRARRAPVARARGRRARLQACQSGRRWAHRGRRGARDVDARCDSAGARGDASFARRCSRISSSSRRSRSSASHARGAQTVGYELLVRLRNSAGELLAPDKFLEACAQYGLLPALDRWVLCAAVEALRPHARVARELAAVLHRQRVSAVLGEPQVRGLCARDTRGRRFAAEPVLLRDQGGRGRQPTRRRRRADPRAHQRRRQGRARRLRLRA